MMNARSGEEDVFSYWSCWQSWLFWLSPDKLRPLDSLEGFDKSGGTILSDFVVNIDHYRLKIARSNHSRVSPFF